MRLTYEEAIEVAQGLKTLRFCPDAEGLATVARDLVLWCGEFPGWIPSQQAAWIIQKIRNEWDEWHGSKLMREIFDQKFTIHPDDPSAQWKRQGLQADPAFVESILGTINGKASPEQLDALRWESIRDALHAEAQPMAFCRSRAPNCKCSTCKEAHIDRQFWAEFLAQASKEHAQEVAAIRAGRRPEHPAPDAYKSHWESKKRSA